MKPNHEYVHLNTAFWRTPDRWRELMPDEQMVLIEKMIAEPRQS